MHDIFWEYMGGLSPLTLLIVTPNWQQLLPGTRDQNIADNCSMSANPMF